MNETRVRVRYAETDQMGVVYHSNYLIWMEVGRVELCRSLGMRYKDMEQIDKVFLVVAEVTCRYHYPARYDEEIIVRTSIAQASAKVVKFAYEMLSASEMRKICTGSTTHVFCGEDMRPCRLPASYWSAFGIT